MASMYVHVGTTLNAPRFAVYETFYFADLTAMLGIAITDRRCVLETHRGLPRFVRDPALQNIHASIIVESGPQGWRLLPRPRVRNIGS